MQINVNESGLRMVFKPYQHYLLSYIWEIADEKHPIGSKKAYEFIQTTDDKKSRASVIFFMNDLVDEGVLGWHDRTGKGGHHRVYYPLMNEHQFWKYLAHKVYAKLVEASGDAAIFE